MTAVKPSPILNLATLIFSLLCLTTFASAHLMDGRHGTLNITNGGGFLVLATPESMFLAFDKDKNKILSQGELASSYDEIKRHIQNHVQLLDNDNNALRLEGIMLSLAPSNGEQGNSGRNLIILGRFALEQMPDELFLKITLGTKTQEDNYFEVEVTGNGYSQTMSFSSEKIRNRVINTIF
ncbi:MAG: hypothetical protein CMK36_00610 [Porticoccaceae bacterium]|nr:hypothetical protein [Porticoccaceae bacterium]